MKIAAVTMVYNESWNLPIWLRHYAGQVGEEHCFVVDHGSDDGSTDDLGAVNMLRLPRSPQNDSLRTEFISELVTSLLRYHDYVIYADCDELVVPDPRKFTGIKDYLEKSRVPFVTSIGIDLLHKLHEEIVIDATRPISLQRSYGHYSSAMNKPNITATPVVWSPGFHSRPEPAAFGDVFVFHLRYADLTRTLERLAVTRAMPWAIPQAGSHQRVSDHDLTLWMERWGRLRVVPDDPWSADAGVLQDYLQRFKDEEKVFGQNRPCSVNTVVFGSELLRLPLAFRGAF